MPTRILKTLFSHLKQIKNIWKYKLYLLLGVVSFPIFLYLTFPINKIAPILERRLEDRITRSLRKPVQLELSGVSTYRVSGLKSDSVRINVQDRGEKETQIKIENLKIRFNILPLLLSRFSFSGGLTTFGGNLSGRVSFNSKKTKWDILGSGENLKAGSLASTTTALFFPMWSDIHLGGHLKADADMFLDFGSTKLWKGTVNISSRDLTLKPSKFMVFALPEISTKSVSLKTSLKDGNLNIDECKIDSESLRLTLSGSIKLGMPFRNSSANIKTKVFFSDEIRKQVPILETALAGREPDSSGHYDFAYRGPLRKIPFLSF